MDDLKIPKSWAHSYRLRLERQIKDAEERIKSYEKLIYEATGYIKALNELTIFIDEETTKAGE